MKKKKIISISPTIHLERFVDSEKNHLRCFEAWWRRKHVEERSKFPLEMKPEEWWEQYLIYSTTSKENL